MTQARTRGPDEKFCGACGKAINVRAQNCPHCGVPQAGDAVIATPPAVAPVAQPAAAAPATPSAFPPTRTILGADEQYCSSCGAVVKKAAELCPACGVRQHAPAPRTPVPVTQNVPVNQIGPVASDGKSKWVAFTLAFLFGGVGIHKFYLRKYAQGFIYLAFFWTFIPSVVALIESLVYLFTPPETFRQRYPNE